MSPSASALASFTLPVSSNHCFSRPERGVCIVITLRGQQREGYQSQGNESSPDRRQLETVRKGDRTPQIVRTALIQGAAKSPVPFSDSLFNRLNRFPSCPHIVPDKVCRSRGSRARECD